MSISTLKCYNNLLVFPQSSNPQNKTKPSKTEQVVQEILASPSRRTTPSPPLPSRSVHHLEDCKRFPSSGSSNLDYSPSASEGGDGEVPSAPERSEPIGVHLSESPRPGRSQSFTQLVPIGSPQTPVTQNFSSMGSLRSNVDEDRGIVEPPVSPPPAQQPNRLSLIITDDTPRGTITFVVDEEEDGLQFEFEDRMNYQEYRPEFNQDLPIVYLPENIEVLSQTERAYYEAILNGLSGRAAPPFHQTCRKCRRVFHNEINLQAHFFCETTPRDS